MREEIWRDIPNYKGIYQVSNLGRVKSLFRYIESRKGVWRGIHEKILKPMANGQKRKYYRVTLSKNGKLNIKTIHQLVALVFLNHTPNRQRHIDHINNNPLDNRLENLQIITQRENNTKDRRGGTSKYTGVWKASTGKKWGASISINSKAIRLGYFNNEIDASNAYKKRLKEYNETGV